MKARIDSSELWLSSETVMVSKGWTQQHKVSRAFCIKKTHFAGCQSFVCLPEFSQFTTAAVVLTSNCFNAKIYARRRVAGSPPCLFHTADLCNSHVLVQPRYMHQMQACARQDHRFIKKIPQCTSIWSGTGNGRYSTRFLGVTRLPPSPPSSSSRKHTKLEHAISKGYKGYICQMPQLCALEGLKLRSLIATQESRCKWC